MFSIPQLEDRTSEYLYYAKQAGIEFAERGRFSEHTWGKLSELLFPPDAFLEMANASWEINDSSGNYNQKDKSLNFMRQMAAVYNREGYTKDVVIEFYFKDLDKTYHFV